MIDTNKIVDDYLQKRNWEAQSNSNQTYCYGSLNNYISGEISKDYWLNNVYPRYIREKHTDGAMHIHDLSGLTLYCCGYSLKSILLKGIKGASNIAVSSPAKHFDACLNQIANIITNFQNEILGAVALNSVDTLISPFVKADNLEYKQVKQHIQNFIYSINSNSRNGAEPAFTNVTFDLTPPEDLLNEKAIVGGAEADFTYADCQTEMDMINRAFFEIMLGGDADGRPFAYPIPTYNIHKRFDWDNPNNELLWEMTGKHGYPYFANYINSDMSPEDSRSMCCRLRLDLKELRKRNGGLFGSGDGTGSIGVVTINYPRLAYKHRGDKRGFYRELDVLLECARDSLEIKRKWLQENVIENNLLPLFNEYVGTLDNHFSTIGCVGFNEMCENFYPRRRDIVTEIGHAFSREVAEHTKNRIAQFQQSTGHLYNFEATPAEATCYRFALMDREKYKYIITQGTKAAPYYTNSCHIPVDRITGIQDIFEHQDDLQTIFTGGTVIHLYTNTEIPGETAKNIIKSACENYHSPYISISPLNRYCDDHGYVAIAADFCPKCGRQLEKYQRITGYIRRVSNFNDGKKSEFRDRIQLNVTAE